MGSAPSSRLSNGPDPGSFGAHFGFADRSAPIFVGGMPRSGTTLVRAILDAHPNIACGPELRAAPALAAISNQTRTLMGDTLREHYHLSGRDLDDVFADLILSFLAPYRAKHGKPRIAEKTPANVLHFAELARLFPHSPLIHVIRDGRDVVASLLTMNWREARSGQKMPITADPGEAAAAWVRHVRSGQAGGKAAGARYFEIRYEAIVVEPRAALQGLFDFLGEDWCEETLDFHRYAARARGVNEASAPQVEKPIYMDSIGRWRRDLDAGAIAAVMAQAGPLLHELGYADAGG